MVPNCFLLEASFHTSYTPSWNVLGEFVSLGGTKMIVVDLNGYDRCRHMESKDV
jgi:hypothetical protein